MWCRRHSAGGPGGAQCRACEIARERYTQWLLSHPPARRTVCGHPTKKGNACPESTIPWPCKYHNQAAFYELRRWIKWGRAAICECNAVMTAGVDHTCTPGDRP
jgi:hypothetical protein